ncbi:hypothetical protein [Streptomyces sp. NPDC127066]|uniref:hypothetical protein n=1 Tax=Streptomyces sp. NPDC127066 TaxID=3347125 RepID=UPI0036538F71
MSAAVTRLTARACAATTGPRTRRREATAHAIRAVTREDDEPTATGHDGFDVDGTDPTVDPLPAEVILSGRPLALPVQRQGGG